jgi:hypothetical protein
MIHSLQRSLGVTVVCWLAFLCWICDSVDGFAFHGATSRFFIPAQKNGPNNENKPKLILISGSPGTGKSTFGMTVALDQGILKCISTDTVRAVMRSFVSKDVSPALHRSSYAPAFEGDDPVRSWKETCTVLHHSVDELVDDAIKRGVSLVVEGVHVIPSKEFIDRWEQAGGVAVGCLLQIQDPERHKAQLRRRGFMTGQISNEKSKLHSFDRIRAIQDEMMKLAQESNWLRIEQRTEADPCDLVAASLAGISISSQEESHKQLFVEPPTPTVTTSVAATPTVTTSTTTTNLKKPTGFDTQEPLKKEPRPTSA